VVRARVGYAGGRAPSPTYDNLGDHTETVQVDFDPATTSYEQLLAVFLATDNPCARAGTRQYMSAVFYHDEAQKELALEALRREEARGTPVAAAVLPVGTFYLAEDYHQKFLLRQEAGLLKELRAMYPDPKGLVNSTAAARVNGYLGGHGTEAMIRKEIDQLGLSSEGKQRLLRLWAARARAERAAGP
jgi:peptide-methionine (S)-S-oxide reductase